MTPQGAEHDNPLQRSRSLLSQAQAGISNSWRATAKPLTLLRQAQDLAPQHQGLVPAMVQLLLTRGDEQEAFGLAEALVAAYPASVPGLIALASCQRHCRQWPEAIASYRRAAALDPDHPGVQAALATLSHRPVADSGHSKAAAAALIDKAEASYADQDPAKALPRRLLLVLGMHRSGTSATAGMLCGHGFQAPLAAHTLPADAFNPRGYWEPSPVVAAHATLLDEEGLGWDDPFLPTAAWEARLQPHHGEAICEALRLAFDNESFAERILVVKDPRQCRLQPIWNRVLERHGLDAAVVLQQRHPLAVARSLMRREQIPVNRSLLLWLQHSLAAERHTRHLPRLIVDYQQVLADPGAVLARCQALWPQHPFEQPGASADSGSIPAIDPTLNHAGADPAAAMAGLGAVDLVLLELALGVHGTLLGPEKCRSDQLNQAWCRLEQHLQGLEEQTVSMATMQLFWCTDNEPDFHEDNSLRATVVPLRRGYDVCTFTLPVIAGRVVALRLDPAETPSLVRLERLELLGPAGQQIWLWEIEANSDAFPGRAVDARTRLIPSRSGPLWICEDRDPSLLLVLPPPVWDSLGEGARLRIHSHRDLLSHELRDLLTQREQV